MPTPDKNTLLETVLIELFETDTACNNLKKAVEKCKNNWQLQIHPDKFSGDADLKIKAENCSALLNALWSMAPDFTSQSGGPGLTRALRKYELKLWPVRCKTAEASVPQKKPTPSEPPPEAPKPPPKLVHLDADKEASECLLQRMALRGRNGETRLIVCDVSPDKLINQAATHVATLPIKFTGDASDVTAITAHVDQFLSQNGVLSEEKRSLVRSRAVERYLQNPEIAEDRKRVQTAVEESAVDDAKNQLLSDGQKKMPTPELAARWGRAATILDRLQLTRLDA